MGLISQFLGVILICFYDFSLTLPLPSYVYISFALFVFLGQTFDAIDGKHARNTNQCSALGQLMDHGCDAFSSSFVNIMLSQTFNFGGGFYTFLLLASIQVNKFSYKFNLIFIKILFFAAQWEENQTKIIQTHINNIGVTETQFLTMALLIIPVFFGDFFSRPGFFMISISNLICCLGSIS